LPQKGRPVDSPLTKAEKAMVLAVKRKKDAKHNLFKKRDEFRRGAAWGRAERRGARQAEPLQAGRGRGRVADGRRQSD